jgi:hypothetical protein
MHNFHTFPWLPQGNNKTHKKGSWRFTEQPDRSLKPILVWFSVSLPPIESRKRSEKDPNYEVEISNIPRPRRIK